jgi:TonB family protein
LLPLPTTPAATPLTTPLLKPPATPLLKPPVTPPATAPAKRHSPPPIEPSAEPTYGISPTVAPAIEPSDAPTAAPTLAPSAVPIAQPTASAVACLIPNAPARIVDRAREVYPKSWIGSGQSPVVDVKVDLDERGDVSHATIVQSGNSKAFDDAAMEAALRSTYAAPVENCTPRAGTILFHVKFYLSD